MGTHGYNIKTYVVGTHEKHLTEVLLMSTRTFFRGENPRDKKNIFVDNSLIWSYGTAGEQIFNYSRESFTNVHY